MTVDVSKPNKVSDELIEALVTHNDEGARAYGRLLATEIPDLMERYMNEETGRSNTPEIMLDVVTRFFASTVSSYLSASSEEAAFYAIEWLGKLFLHHSVAHQRALRIGGK